MTGSPIEGLGRREDKSSIRITPVRVLNLSIMVPAGKTLVVPVSCVESGRWHHRSREFAAAPRAHYAGERARKMAQVSESLRISGRRTSNQGEVWDHINEKFSRFGSSSATSARTSISSVSPFPVNLRVSLLSAKPVREAHLRRISLLHELVMEKTVRVEDLSPQSTTDESQAMLRRFMESCPDDLRVRGDELRIVVAVAAVQYFPADVDPKGGREDDVQRQVGNVM